MNIKSPQSQEEKVFNKISQMLLEKKGLQTIIPQGSKGGFGLVLFVQDINTKLKYAVKAQTIVDEAIGGIDDDKYEMCKAESEILKSIKHKNIVEYHSDYIIGFYHFIQMNLCECSLDDWIQKRANKPLSYGLFLHFLNQILDGIEHLHNLNYILRDLSAKNILISSDGTIKLCDFGLAKKIETQIMASKIQSNNVKGVFVYYPPELIKEIESNSNTFTQSKSGDIWALGICLSLLGGLKFHEVVQFNQPGAQIKQSPLLDNFCNQIIQFILKENPKERPNISLIRKFIFDKLSQNIEQQQINQSNKAYDSKEENDNFYNQRDFEIDIQKYRETEEKCLKDLNNIESLIQLSQINLYCYQDVNKANEYLIDAMFINNNDPDIYLSLAQIQIYVFSIEKKKNEKIDELINKASQISPNYYRVYIIKYLKYLIEGKRDQAMKELQKGNEKKKRYAFIIGHQFFVQFVQSEDMNERKQIQKQFENELNQFPIKYRHYYVHLAYMNNELGEYEKAIEYYQQQLKQIPKDIFTLGNIGINYEKLQKYDVAIEYYKKALEINPNYQFAKDNLKDAESKLKSE